MPTPTAADDKLAVAETIYRYALGIDTRDWDLYGSIFADEIAIDFTSYRRGEATTATREQWLRTVVPLMTGLAATQHTMTNALAEVADDTATCRMYMQAHHVYRPDEPDSWFTIGGYYDDTLIRSKDSPSGWLLTGVTLTVLWRKGDASIMDAARADGRAALVSS